jgi:hypothetical protein
MENYLPNFPRLPMYIIIIEKFQTFNQWKAFYLPTYSGKIIICPLLYPPYPLLPFIYYPCWTYLPTYLVITARLPVLWMEFTKCRSFYRLRCRPGILVRADLGNLNFLIGQKNGGTMDSSHGAFKQRNGLWLCPTCEGFHLDLQNGHVNFAEWSCGFCRMVLISKLGLVTLNPQYPSILACKAN